MGVDKIEMSEDVIDDEKDDSIDIDNSIEARREAEAKLEEALAAQVEKMKKLEKAREQCRCAQLKKDIADFRERWDAQRKAKNQKINELEDENEKQRWQITELKRKMHASSEDISGQGGTDDNDNISV